MPLISHDLISNPSFFICKPLFTPVDNIYNFIFFQILFYNTTTLSVHFPHLLILSYITESYLIWDFKGKDVDLYRRLGVANKDFHVYLDS